MFNHEVAVPLTLSLYDLPAISDIRSKPLVLQVKELNLYRLSPRLHGYLLV